MRLLAALIFLALVLLTIMLLSVPPWATMTDDPSDECIDARMVYAANPVKRNFDDVFTHCYRP